MPERQVAADLGRPIAIGRTAEVYGWDKAHILKLFREGWGRREVEYEARVAGAVHAAGLPVPAVGEIVDVGGRSRLVYERVNGPSLLEAFEQRPWRLWWSTHLPAIVEAGLGGA